MRARPWRRSAQHSGALLPSKGLPARSAYRAPTGPRRPDRLQHTQREQMRSDCRAAPGLDRHAHARRTRERSAPRRHCAVRPAENPSRSRPEDCRRLPCLAQELRTCGQHGRPPSGSRSTLSAVPVWFGSSINRLRVGAVPPSAFTSADPGRRGPVPPLPAFRLRDDAAQPLRVVMRNRPGQIGVALEDFQELAIAGEGDGGRLFMKAIGKLRQHGLSGAAVDGRGSGCSGKHPQPRRPRR